MHQKEQKKKQKLNIVGSSKTREAEAEELPLSFVSENYFTVRCTKRSKRKEQRLNVIGS